MGHIQGEGRGQGSLFPVALDDLVSVDQMCRVIDAFVARLAFQNNNLSVCPGSTLQLTGPDDIDRTPLMGRSFTTYGILRDSILDRGKRSRRQ